MRTGRFRERPASCVTRIEVMLRTGGSLACLPILATARPPPPTSTGVPSGPRRPLLSPARHHHDFGRRPFAFHWVKRSVSARIFLRESTRERGLARASGPTEGPIPASTVTPLGPDVLDTGTLCTRGLPPASTPSEAPLRGGTGQLPQGTRQPSMFPLGSEKPHEAIPAATRSHLKDMPNPPPVRSTSPRHPPLGATAGRPAQTPPRRNLHSEGVRFPPSDDFRHQTTYKRRHGAPAPTNPDAANDHPECGTEPHRRIRLRNCHGTAAKHPPPQAYSDRRSPVGTGFEPEASACPGVRVMHSAFRAFARFRGPAVGSRSPQNGIPGHGQNGSAKR